jgi:hypothetical protein
MLADLWPGDGLPIKSITSTLGNKLQYQLTPAAGQVDIGLRRLHKRYNLELSFLIDPTSTSFDHTVTITPGDSRAKPVEVHLVGRITPRCGLDTDTVVFCGSRPGQQISRRIEYRYRDASDGEIQLVKCPPWMSMSVSEVHAGLKILTLTCSLPDCKGERAEEACFEFGRDKRSLAVPVFLSCRADPGRER